MNAETCRAAVFILMLHPMQKSLQEKNMEKKHYMLGSVNHTYHESYRRDIVMEPPRNQFYNPNPGYAPYWPGGEWPFEKLQTSTSQQPDTLCGNECPELYREFGQVCARNILFEFQTFKDYCELVNDDCLGRKKWLIAYRGECMILKTYPTKQSELVTRAMQHLFDLEARMSSQSNG